MPEFPDYRRIRAGVDTAARIGGEEFAVVLPGIDQPQAMSVAERLRTAIATEPVTFDGHLFTITTSIGVVSCPLHAQTTDALLQAADIALYTAKHAGRDRISGPPVPLPTARHDSLARQTTAP